MRVEVVPSEALAPRAAIWVADRLWAAVAERGQAHVAFSGGSTPSAMFAALVGLRVPWESVHVWQVDERIAPDADPDRNLVALSSALLDHVRPAVVHLMDVTAADQRDAADRYAMALDEACPSGLDVVHLGLGDDGHTASWPPGDEVVLEAERLVALSGEYQGRLRMTLTVPAIAQARRRLVLVAGAGKADAIRRFVADDPAIPAHHVPRRKTTLLCDLDAATSIPSHLLGR